MSMKRIQVFFIRYRKKIFLLAIFLYAAFAVFWYRDFFFTPLDLQWVKQQYESSAYVIGNSPSARISDEVVYEHAGNEYFKGVRPTSINFEHPPFAKYMFGLSTLVSRSPSWANIAFLFILLLCFIHVAEGLYEDKRLIYVAFLLYISNTLLFSFIWKPMLDLPLTAMMFLTITTYLFYLKRTSWKTAALFGLTAGLYLATKYPFPLSIALVLLLLSWSVAIKKTWIHGLVSLAAMAFSYLATYTVEFLRGMTLLEFAKFELWRLHWYTGKTDQPKGLMLQTVLFGRHKAWWIGGGEVFYEKYSILWPVSFLLYVLSWLFARLPFRHPYFPVAAWAGLSFALLLLGASNDYYLVPLMPLFVLFGVKLFDKANGKKLQ